MIRVAGAKVEVVDGPGAGTSTLTDEDGRFSLSGPWTGGVSLLASKEGFESETVLVSPVTWWENFALVPIGTTQEINLGETITSIITGSEAPCSNIVSPIVAEGSWPFGGPCKRFKVATNLSQSGTLSVHLHSENGLLLNLGPSGGACCKNVIDFPATAGSIRQLTVDIHAGAPPAPFTLTTSIQ